MHASRIWERDRKNEALVVLKKGSSAKLQCRAGRCVLHSVQVFKYIDTRLKLMLGQQS